MKGLGPGSKKRFALQSPEQLMSPNGMIDESKAMAEDNVPPSPGKRPEPPSMLEPTVRLRWMDTRARNQRCPAVAENEIELQRRTDGHQFRRSVPLLRNTVNFFTKICAARISRRRGL